jgi:hypothetical protein
MVADCPARRGSNRYANIFERGKIFDADYLKHFTNAAYLTATSGKFVRDPATGKPLIFDQSDGRVKVFDDAGVKDPMLEGETEVQAQKVRPAFELIKTRAAEYSAERVEEITTIPAKTLRRIAREFGEAASIGATVRIDGVEVPTVGVSRLGPVPDIHAWHHTRWRWSTWSSARSTWWVAFTAPTRRAPSRTKNGPKPARTAS